MSLPAPAMSHPGCSEAGVCQCRLQPVPLLGAQLRQRARQRPGSCSHRGAAQGLIRRSGGWGGALGGKSGTLCVTWLWNYGIETGKRGLWIFGDGFSKAPHGTWAMLGVPWQHHVPMGSVGGSRAQGWHGTRPCSAPPAAAMWAPAWVGPAAVTHGVRECGRHGKFAGK